MTSDRRREMALGGVVILLAVAGIVSGAVGRDITPPDPDPVSNELFVERSVFCSPLGEAEGQAASGRATHATSSLDDDAIVGVEPNGEAPKEIDGGVLVTELVEARATAFTGFGAELRASSAFDFEGPTAGSGAGRCSEAASDTWYFPYGSSDRGFNEWLLLHNPFPDEAVARVTFLTQGGARTPARVSDLAVPAGRTTVVKINEVLLQTKGLGIEVRTLRGRIVAWEALFAQPENRAPGAGLTLGSPEAATEWYLPAGAVGEGEDERVAVMNPTSEEAIVTLSVITDKQALQPSGLVEVAIPARTSREFNLRQQLEGKDLGGTSVAVRSVNEVPIAVGRANWYSDGSFEGFTLENGAPGGGTDWWVGPAATKPQRDSLVMMNTGEADATVEVGLIGKEGGEPITGGSLSGITIPPGGRVRVDLSEAGPGLSVALVRSSAPIAVERIAYASGDVATVMGVLLDRQVLP